MTTNFGHLKPWNRIYEYAIDMEEQILEASTVIKYKNAIGAARKVLECMLGEMTKAAGVTDGIIKETLRANGKNADYVSNYGRILALKSIGLLSPESVKNLLALNSDGNAGNHPNSELYGGQ